MPSSKAHQRATAKYNLKTYDNILVRVSKGKKADLQAHAKDQNESLNGFVNRAIDNQIKMDKGGE